MNKTQAAYQIYTYYKHLSYSRVGHNCREILTWNNIMFCWMEKKGVRMARGTNIKHVSFDYSDAQAL